MKLHRYEGSDSRRVIAALVSSSVVLGRLAPLWPDVGGLFRDPALDLIGRWCVDHQRRYGRAPGRAIRDRFERWAAGGDEQLADRIAKTLSEADREHDPAASEDYLLDLVQGHLDRLELRRAVDQARDELSAGRSERAAELVDKRRRINLRAGGIFDPAGSPEKWVAALDSDHQRALITLPGAAGRFLGAGGGVPDFARDCFVALMGPAGRGKSWWLIDLAYRAARQRCRVAYFEAGDNSEPQLIRRLAQRALRRPRFDREVLWPIDYSDPAEEPQRERRRLRGIEPHAARREWARISRGRSAFRASCHGNSSLTIGQMRSILEDWDRAEGWRPDVLVVDYADILANENQRERRDGINANWQGLRRISQDWHCLVLTATQADAASYEAGLLRRKNFTDDRRKFDHVTGYFGLNQTDREKRAGIMRLNWLKRRDEAYTETAVVHVAGSLECGCPAIRSCWPGRAEGGEAEADE